LVLPHSSETNNTTIILKQLLAGLLMISSQSTDFYII